MKNPSADQPAQILQVQNWAEQLHTLSELIGHRFPRAEPRQRAFAYLRGLLSPVERRNSWQLAEQAGDSTPYALQHLLSRAQWSADAVRDDLQSYVIAHLADSSGVLILDETGFLKKGNKSAGVARQYSGTAGRIENSQIGVFLVYASSKGRTFLDRELYLPKAWTEDRVRCKAAAIPEEVKFATKLQLGRRMLQRAFAAHVTAKWVAGDSVYGNDSQMRGWLDERRQAYILGVTAQLRLWTGERRQWASEVVKSWPDSKWQQLSCGAGSKGERIYEWANMVIRKCDSGWQRWLLARRNLSDRNEVSYYVAGGPKQTQIEEMARVAGARWAIEESFETARGEVGLDHYEVRSWTGWYRHITLAMLAHAYLTVMRSKSADEATGVEKKGGWKSGRQKN